MLANKAVRYVYEFGPYFLDLDERTLLRDGLPVPLPPKVFDALVVFVENSGQILDKEDLLNRIWADAFVEEGNLTQTVFQLRKALGESGTKQQFIETVPRRGYRFVAEVRVVPKDEFPTENGGRRFEPRAEVLPFPVNGHLGETFSQPVPPRVGPRTESVSASDSQEIEKPTKSLALIFGVVAVAALAVFGGFRLADRLRSKPVPGDSLQTRRIVKLTTSGRASPAALSPNGTYVAFVVDDGGRQSLWVRQTVSSNSVRVVESAETLYRGVAFSRDGSFIFFLGYERGQNKGALFKVPILGGTPQKILADIDSPPSFSPDGTRFAFVRLVPRENETALMTASADGTDERRLAVEKAPRYFSLSGPAWSPDGQTVAVAVGERRFDGVVQPAVVHVADGKLELVGTRKWGWIGQTAWLKNGGRIVFDAWDADAPIFADQLWSVSYPEGVASRVTNDVVTYNGVSASDTGTDLVTARSDRVSRLRIETLDGPNRGVRNTVAFSDNYGEFFGMDMAADGRIVYAAQTSGNLDVWMTDAEGDDPRQLTFNPGPDSNPVVSPDGRTVVFVSVRVGARRIWRMDTDGRGQKQLSDGDGDDQPTISPDGKRVVYSAADGPRRVLRQVSIEGGPSTTIAEGNSLFPTFSPDGTRLAFLHRDPTGGRARFAVVRFDASGVAQPPEFLPEGGPMPEHGTMRWTPDGRSLAFVVTKDGVSNLWARPLDGGEARQLTNFTEDRIYRFAWSPDGKRLACERGATVKDVLLFGNL